MHGTPGITRESATNAPRASQLPAVAGDPTAVLRRVSAGRPRGVSEVLATVNMACGLLCSSGLFFVDPAIHPTMGRAVRAGDGEMDLPTEPAVSEVLVEIVRLPKSSPWGLTLAETGARGILLAALGRDRMDLLRQILCGAEISDDDIEAAAMGRVDRMVLCMLAAGDAVRAIQRPGVKRDHAAWLICAAAARVANMNGSSLASAGESVVRTMFASPKTSGLQGRWNPSKAFVGPRQQEKRDFWAGTAAGDALVHFITREATKI